MQPENENTAPNRPDDASDSPMSILERRLAEIARSKAADSPAADAPQPQAAASAPAAPEAPIVPQPAEVGTGLPSAADLPVTAPAVATEPTATTPSEPLQRAEEHYGTANEGVRTAEAALATGPEPTEPVPAAAVVSEPASDAPATAAPATGTPSASQEQAPVAATTEEPIAVTLPAHELAQAADIETAPEPLAALPTSNNESATEAAHADAAHHAAPAAMGLSETPGEAQPGGSTNAPQAAAAAHHEEDEEYVPETPAPDFATLDVTAQGAYILELLRRPDARQNRKQINDLHRLYEQSVNVERQAARQRFVQEGNEADAFSFAGPDGYAEVSKGMQDYRDARVRDAKQEDEQRAKNLLHKQHLLSQLRQLVESAETKDSSARIKTLQADWKATGPVPQAQAQELWNSYHALLDIYYNNRGLFFEMKELDRRRNQEAKEALIQRAEALAGQSSINKALQELRQLHEEWKTVGPVPNDMREPLWQRFLQASEKVHDRKRSFLDARSAQENANLARKQEILTQILPYGEFKTERVNEWRAKTDELQALKEQWDSAGLVPRSQAESMNKQFWAAYKGFFQHKNQFFKALDEEKSNNLKQKIALCEQAEAALENPDWEAGRETVIRVQKEWKLIGRVPEKQSDKIWHRFRTACDAFFERKHQEVRHREQQVQQASAEQSAFLDRIAEQVAALSADTPGTQEGLQALVQEWAQFDSQGNRRGSAQAEEKFLSLAGKYIDTIPGLSYQEREEQQFQLQVQRMKANPDAQQLLYRKEQQLRRDINELENDIATLQTNLDFFARSKNAGQLREEYQGRIDETKVRIERMKRQLRIVRS
ncbi:DUF349 domain-containing protein [Hymenobacter busanensis]|uniref:DUF349 domain-containing protein n=1 Tax=Hymenobacter busanensis TaxID=2607656 RepID=A0A7L4ZTQ5_9BACT|nr:DUF349 domain-containing protein [Hymenobacter busanensis]KAA9325813.1 DUF349 domain-containing protein [Hymenobacter busanensis]QHJ06347.1 DUF349 domain-containing protein [Hymenobacter busanensis]